MNTAVTRKSDECEIENPEPEISANKYPKDVEDNSKKNDKVDTSSENDSINKVNNSNENEAKDKITEIYAKEDSQFGENNSKARISKSENDKWEMSSQEVVKDGSEDNEAFVSEDLKATAANASFFEDSDSEEPSEEEIKVFMETTDMKGKVDSISKDPGTSDASNLSPLATTRYYVEKKDEETRTSTKKLRPCTSCEDLLDPFELLEVPGCFSFLRRPRKRRSFRECWFIAVPKEDKTWEELNTNTGKNMLSQNYKFHIPVLKVGTLNTLMSLLEELKSLDKFVGDVTKQLCEYIKGELKDKPDSLKENLQVRNLPPVTYLTRFTWDKAKYPTWFSLPEIADLLYTRVDDISNRMKLKLTMFEKLKSKVQKFENRESDSLNNRYLGDIVKKEHFMYTRVLTTLLVIVPNEKVTEWLNSYHQFCKLVVPNSSSQLFKDTTHTLFNVIICRKEEDDFKANAMKNNFVVRDYEYSESNQLAEKIHYENLIKIKVKELVMIFRWMKINFSECFEAWIHVMALRIFVESALRFGLPVNYESVLLIPLGSKKKLTKVLGKLYNDVDASLSKGYIEEVPGALTVFDVQSFFPYVFFNLNLEFLYHER